MAGDKPLKILHVDDEENQLEFTKIFLEQIEKDVEIDSVTDPEEALKRQEEEGYDCIVSDYKMLSMNGIELAQKVREKSDVPFILYTGQGSEEVAELAFSAGVDDYLRKEAEPTHYQVLAKRIKHTVEKHRKDELYRKVVEESRDGILIIVNNKIAFLNRSVCIMFGINFNKGIGKDISEYVINENNKKIDFSAIKKKNYIIDGKYITKLKDIRKAELSISRTTYRGEEAHLVFIRDITDKKINEKRLNAIYEQSVRLGASKTIQEISETTLDIMEKLFKNKTVSFYSLEDNNLKLISSRGKTSFKLHSYLNEKSPISKVAKENTSTIFNNLLENKELKNFTKYKSQLVVPALINKKTIAILNVESQKKNDFTEKDIQILESLSAQVAFAFNRINTDKLIAREIIHKRNKLNYALNILENAEKTNNLLTTELQNNIINILNTTEMLRFQPEMIFRGLDSINNKASNAKRITESIRDKLSEITQIHGVIEINQSIKEILEKYNIPKGILLKIQYDTNILFVEIEHDIFSRIIYNLLTNSIEAMNGVGSLSIKISSNKEKTYIDISDTGPGIPDYMLKKIFEPFNTHKSDKNGIGLAFCKNATESVGGSIKVKLTSTKGTTFRLSFPLIKWK